MMAVVQDADQATPDRDAEDQEALRADISHDITEYIARYDCHNIDTTVDPVDLLRRVDRMMEQYDRDLEERDQQIEKLQAGENDELVKLRLEVEDLRKLKTKVDSAPWFKRVIERIP